MASTNVLWFCWIIWASALVGVYSHNTPPTLPIYSLHPEPISKHRAIELIKALYNVTQPHVKEDGTRVIVTCNNYTLEVDTAHGGIWSSDESRLWNHALRPRLVDQTHALGIANKLIDTHHLLPNHSTSPLRLKFHEFSGTRLAVLHNSNRSDYYLDTRLIYTTTVNVPGRSAFPVVGGGGSYQIVLGENGRLIAFHGTSPKTAYKSFQAKVIPQKDADKTFLEMMTDTKIETYNSSLAYYIAPAFTKQEFLYPVYVYEATTLVGGRTVQVRRVTLPATDFGPPIIIPKIQHSTRPPRPTETRTARARSIPWKRHDDHKREFGTSWIQWRDNAQNFVAEMLTVSPPWTKVFNWGNEAAWESDWNRNDDFYVDAVDFVFYTGHADGNGWQLSPPDDGDLTVSDVVGLPDRWGKQDCEWIVIAACGPLQDDIIGTGGSVFRWRPAFDGLHMLLGYGTVSGDNSEEGRTLVQYAKSGRTVKSSWFRAALNTQSSGVWAAALWGASPGADPGYDHIWGQGSVSPDPVSPNTWYAMWVPIL